LETHLSLAEQKLAETSEKKIKALSKASEAAHSNLAKTNERLREDNANLMDEIEELREMVEILKTRDKLGLVSDPSSSPRMSVFSR
jgi:cysteine sulfinate desulfinase/cysteine desulfurase-like protein